MGITNNLNYVAKMDEEAGLRILGGRVNAVFNTALDLASIIVPILKPISTVKRFFKIASYANYARNAVVDFSNGDWKKTIMPAIEKGLGVPQHKLANQFGEALGVVNTAVGVKDLVDAFSKMGYKVEFID